MNKSLIRLVLIAATSVALGVLSACSERTHADILEAARAHLAAGNQAAAVVELKQAIQAAPGDAKSRFMLGSAFAGLGQWQAAEVELRKALDLGYPVNELAVAYFKTLFENRKFKVLIEESEKIQVSKVDDSLKLKTLIASANAQIGDVVKSDMLVQEILKSSPGYSPAMIIHARNQLRAGKVETALGVAEQVLVGDAENVDALQIKGEVETYSKGRIAEGRKIFERIVATHPSHVDANLGLVSILIATKDIDSAQRRVDTLAKLKPGAPQTNFMVAQVALAKRDFDRARAHVQPLLQAAPDSIDFLQLAGAIELEAGAFVKAEALLGKVLGLAPDKANARLLMARLNVLTERPTLALAVLSPLISAGVSNTDALLQAAYIHQQLGDVSSADALLARVLKVSPSDARLRLALAMSKLAKGQTESGLSELHELSTSETTGVADITLYSIYLARNDFVGAAKAIDSLERKLPNQPIAANLRGRIAIFSRNVSEAKRQFQQALLTDKGYFPAANSLASLFILEGQPAQALEVFGEVLKVQPRNVQATLAIAGIKARSGASKDEVVALLDSGIAMNPSDPSARVALIDYLVDVRDLKGAYAAAQAGLVALPNDFSLLERMARVQMDGGEINQAVLSFGKLVALRPTVSALMGLAGAQAAANNSNGAMQTYRRLLDAAGNNASVHRAVVGAMLKVGRHDDAMDFANELRRRLPKDAIGDLLAGDVDASRRRWVEATAQFRKGIGKQGAGQIPLRIHATLLLSKQESDATKFALDWLRANPKDTDFKLYLAEVALSRRDSTTAERMYTEVLDLDAKNPRALNNLAWLMLQTNQPGALPLAERAVAQLPTDAAVLNTYAVALSSAGELSKAIEVLVALAAAKPESLQIQVNLAAAYIKAGKKSDAAALLKSVQSRGAAFKNQAEVTRLLKQV